MMTLILTQDERRKPINRKQCVSWPIQMTRVLDPIMMLAVEMNRTPEVALHRTRHPIRNAET